MFYLGILAVEFYFDFPWCARITFACNCIYQKNDDQLLMVETCGNH